MVLNKQAKEKESEKKLLFFGELCRHTKTELTQNFHLVMQRTFIVHLLWARDLVVKKMS